MLNRFDKIAPYYDRLAFFVYGNAIRKAQMKYLQCIPEQANVLVLGGGTGWWLQALLAQNPSCTVWYIEASLKMIKYSQKNAATSSRIKFIHGTHQDIPDKIRFDAVITFFYLDLFDRNELFHIIGCIKKKMNKNGVWLIADFLNKKMWHAIMLFFMCVFFRVIQMLNIWSLPHWPSIMKNQGLSLLFSTSYFGEFIHSRLYKIQA